MTEVISVKFKNRGKNYYFDPCGVKVETGATVIVNTSRGLEAAQCVKGNHEVEDNEVVQPLRTLARIATEADLRVLDINRKREQEALGICRQKIEEHGLDMKLVDVECSFEGNKILFFFTSDGRVDFRELVKDLASVFRSRIELRQIGVRDEAKMLGGIGICGRPYCCNQFLTDFHPVSTKMAKVQSMSLNPAKISGACGRLMCCLRYEQQAYEELVKAVPKVGAFVETPAGYGVVTSVNILRSSLKVKLDGDGDPVLKSYLADEIAVIPGGRPKPGEPLPQLLKDRPKPVREPEEPEDDWIAPSLFGEEPEPPAAEQPKKKRSRRSRGGKKSGDAARRPEQEAPAKEPSEKPAQPEKSEKPAGAKRSHRGGRRHRSAAKADGGAAQQPKEPKEPAQPKPSAEQGQKKPGNNGGRSRRKRSHRPKGDQNKAE
ncbi:MAG: hypothetical protein IJ112_00715 [Oscillospiraceae bacterium]|nr:hypothetical protein [Oscillospiraceae bacterium]